jgi:hypothetical protein
VRRLRFVTKALLWYPFVCVLATGGFALWQWFDCTSAEDVALCRSEIWPQALLFGASIAAIGLGLLLLAWLITGAFSWGRHRGRGRHRDRGRATSPRASGFEPQETPNGERREPATPGGD